MVIVIRIAVRESMASGRSTQTFIAGGGLVTNPSALMIDVYQSSAGFCDVGRRSPRRPTLGRGSPTGSTDSEGLTVGAPRRRRRLTSGTRIGYVRPPLRGKLVC